MTIRDLTKMPEFQCVAPPANPDVPISVPYCCDLLSAVMRAAPQGCAWCTVMNNVNTLAVASLTESACIILCGGTIVNPEVKEKAIEQGICLFTTDLPIFETALRIHQSLC